MRKFKDSGRKSTSVSRSTSIRGRISAPIPLTTTDDEFPIRGEGTSIALWLGEDGLEREPRAAPKPMQMENVKQDEADTFAAVDLPLRAAPSAPPSTVPSYENPGPQVRQASPLRGSAISNQFGASMEKPQRKKSTLRTVLGKLFGKKRKSDSTANEGTQRADQHRSDPSALRKPGSQTLSTKRSASMPINDFNRALRSHSPYAEDQNAQAASEVRISRDIDGISRPQQVTTPSKLYEPTKSLGYMNWVGLTPRPASSHARDSGAFTAANADEPIGFAVTSGSHPNRRSRSLDQLQDAATEHGMRRRSDEIRYWRESYPSYDPDAMSPMSSQHRAETDFRPTTQDGNSTQAGDKNQTPQPFNFGPLGELAGMKITQAASLDARVSTLEARLERIEKAVTNLHDRISVSTLPLQDYSSRPRTESSDQSFPRNVPNKTNQQSQDPQANSSHRMESRSYESSRPSTTSTQPSKFQSYEELSPRPTYLTSPDPMPEMPPLRSTLSARHSESMGRPLSTSTTIRGIASSSPSRTPDRTLSLSKNGSLTAHHYSALLNLITAEQTARQSLEAQVATLQQQVQSLQSKPGERSSIIYSTPRPIHIPSRQTMGVREVSSFEHEESGTESEGETYSTGGHEEIFQTPSEELGHFVGQDDYEDELAEMESHAGPRTLSLSQMTMGKSALASVAF